MTDDASLGPNVKRRRAQLGWTLEQLADESGVSATMISEVERAVKNPTVRVAYQLARALGCSLNELVEEAVGGPVSLVRARQRRSLVDPKSRVRRHALSSEMLRRGIELAWYVLPAKTSAGLMAPNRPGILEHVSVLAGTLTIVLGHEQHVLARGDGITYGPQTTVEYKNGGRAKCEFLLAADTTRSH